MAVDPYCALPITTTTTTVAPILTHAFHAPHSSLEQAKLDCLQGGHYWISDPNGGGFSYCSWNEPATQAPTTVAPPSTFAPILTQTADSFDNENDCENNVRIFKFDRL